jgi:hypothetical protein
MIETELSEPLDRPVFATRDYQDRKLDGGTLGVVRRSRPIVRTSAQRAARRHWHDLEGVIGRDAELNGTCPGDRCTDGPWHSSTSQTILQRARTCQPSESGSFDLGLSR